MNDIGSRIAIIVKKNGGKNVAFAERLNIDSSYVTQLVNGKRSPSERLILAICREFNVRREWLETGEGAMELETQSQMLDRVARRYSKSRTFRALLDVFMQLDEEGQDSVETYIEKLTDALARSEDPAGVEITQEDLAKNEKHVLEYVEKGEEKGLDKMSKAAGK